MSESNKVGNRKVHCEMYAKAKGQLGKPKKVGSSLAHAGSKEHRGRGPYRMYIRLNEMDILDRIEELFLQIGIHFPTKHQPVSSGRITVYTRQQIFVVE